jgi:drug/metabolite transporter (DMT)-like permease
MPEPPPAEPSRIQWEHARTRGDGPVTVPSSQVTRRWTVIASGLLLLALAMVVIFTRRNAFLSPLAIVVVAAIGLAAILLQVRFHRDLPDVRPPLWLNILGLIFAFVSLFADYVRLKGQIVDLVAFGAVVCFAISGSLILHALRRHAKPPQLPDVE